ncbi:Mad1/Cdc20-bound-Mad2 binding protein [Cinara cedri]|uniref:Mad1/Cdc20-bound-Mad2 binding protein n=1 Tax=Cinara cedri TaxID=506608 RepID=A0A5E4NBX8_9HEMI|nr:Mad1/Cdc20-bound-Mad2 binding protein [Cinara cedri]
MSICDVCVHLSDLMTPQSFTSLVTTLIKYLIYEKQLIPYPYDRLKLYIKKYKEMNSEEENCRNQKKNYRLESDKYYKKVSDAINTLETVFQCIEGEFQSCSENHIESVVILIGSNILNPLTVFNIYVPELTYSHCENQHSSRKHIDNVFQNILNNDQFNDILTSNIMVETNLYVMFKVKPGAQMTTNWWIPKEKFRIFRGKQVVLRFQQSIDDESIKKYETCCFQDCLDFEVFVDLDDKSSVKKQTNTLTESVVDWYVSKSYVTGFKNYKFNGIPISDTWLNPNIINSMVL